MKFYFALTLFLLTFLFSSFYTTASAQTPFYTISGEVRDEFGHLTAGVRVMAKRVNTKPNATVIIAISDENGRFLFRLSNPGTYSIIYEKSSDGYMPQHQPFYKDSSYTIPEVTLDSDNSNVFVPLSLSPKSGVVSGKAVDAKTNLPVENFLITLCHADNPQVCFSPIVKNTEGRFRVMASPVPFTLKIKAEGYEDWLGADGANKPIYLASASSIDLDVSLKRRQETIDSALSESEKQAGVHLPAPAQIYPYENIELNYYPRITRIKWRPVEGAVSYGLEVDYCQSDASRKTECVNPQPFVFKGNQLYVTTSGTSYEVNFIGAQPGRWRVWAIDKEGQAGFKSPWRRFVYLR